MDQPSTNDPLKGFITKTIDERLARMPKGGGSRLPDVWTRSVLIGTRRLQALGISSLNKFSDWALDQFEDLEAAIAAGGGGGGGEADPTVPPCNFPRTVTTRNAAGQATTVTHGAGPTLVTTGLTYNAAGQVTSKASTWANGTRTLTYSYTNGQLNGITSAFVAA